MIVPISSIGFIAKSETEVPLPTLIDKEYVCVESPTKVFATGVSDTFAIALLIVSSYTYTYTLFGSPSQLRV